MSLTGRNAVILAVDPAATSGWAIFDCGLYYASGVAATAFERGAALELLNDVAPHRRRVPANLLVVVEDWRIGRRPRRKGDGTDSGNWSPTTLVRMGESRGRWLERAASAGIPEAQIVHVEPPTWRAVLAGMPRRSGEQAKASAVQLVRMRFSNQVEDENEAEAVCIALWAQHAPEVSQALATAARRAA